jgi:protein SCO1/2
MNRDRRRCEDRGVHRAAVLIAALAVGTATACAGGSSPGTAQIPAASTADVALHGAKPTTAQPRPSFTLVDTAGHRYEFGQRTHGRVTLLYFGYTNCPDECPTSMADVAQALRSVPPAVAAQVSVVFATTDPWRDNATVLRRWLDRFRPPAPFVGLTGTPAEVAGAETTMGMPISTRQPPAKGQKPGQYSVSHFAAVIVYGRDDRLATLYPSGVVPADIAADLKVLVKG